MNKPAETVIQRLRRTHLSLEVFVNGISAAIVVSSWIASLASGAEPTVWVRVPDPATTRPKSRKRRAGPGWQIRRLVQRPSSDGWRTLAEPSACLPVHPRTVDANSKSNSNKAPRFSSSLIRTKDGLRRTYPLNRTWRTGRSGERCFPIRTRPITQTPRRSEPSARIEVLARDFDSFDQITALLKLSRARIVTQARAPSVLRRV